MTLSFLPHRQPQRVMKAIAALLFAGLLVLISATHGAAQFTIDTSVQPANPKLGQDVLVIFTASGPIGDITLPNVEGLTQEGRSTETQVRLNDGVSTRQTFTLGPKRAGNFVIPAFPVHTPDGQIIQVHGVQLYVGGDSVEPTMRDFRLLVLLIAPLAAIFLIVFCKAQPRVTAVFATIFNLLYSIGLILLYPAAQGGYQYELSYQWVNMPGLPPIHFHLGVDGISLPLVFLTAIVSFAAMAVSPALVRRPAEYYSYLLLMSLGAMGAFISLDLFFFYIFHDFALIPTFLLIGIWGSQNRQFASFQVTIYLLAGSLVLLAGMIALVMALPAHERTFDIPALQAYLLAHPLPPSEQNVIFALLTVGFGILVGLFPFHSWAPPGYASAPPAAAMLHAGILKKYALYGMIRIAIPMLHDGFTFWQDAILFLLAGNFIYAGFITLAQKELPMMLGFSSIMHMGYLFLGIACWNTIGVTGAVVLMVAHGLSAALLFGLSGEIVHRSGENRFAELGGLAKRAPVLAILFSFASMASMGVPGLANFAGELMVFFASFPGSLRIFSLIAIYGTVITAIFQLRAIKNIFYGPMPDHFAKGLPVPIETKAGVGHLEAVAIPAMSDVDSLLDRAPYVLLTLASLAFGFMPFLLIHLVQPTVYLLPFVK